ncbi:hypothetical protein B0J15DRAFT_472829 [Fusarium solani]|uniref:Uncharacterized protein n=1 Tax=Fusarium solani TaxID=169388 RepID=A0A9P9G2E9_FUSSL|nr:uncharacterized protein B0J15DRAFT_472829 [Fusarium solani]KAH7230825.1 hypothetical protein B0J15DRAFT_472829 [Fusarium solani]
MSTGKIYHKKVKILPLGGDPVLDKDLAEKDFGSEQGHGQRRFCYGGGSSGREYSVVSSYEGQEAEKKIEGCRRGYRGATRVVERAVGLGLNSQSRENHSRAGRKHVAAVNDDGRWWFSNGGWWAWRRLHYLSLATHCKGQRVVEGIKKPALIAFQEDMAQKSWLRILDRRNGHSTFRYQQGGRYLESAALKAAKYLPVPRVLDKW